MLLQLDHEYPSPARCQRGLIRLCACGLNQVDLFTKDGKTPQEGPLHYISGTKVVGCIVALGAGVIAWQMDA